MTDKPTCNICAREMIDFKNERDRTDDDWINEMAMNCGGDCQGCVMVAEDKAVYAYCAFHDKKCVVWSHYEDSTHLCDPNECIEHQDITTLMLNDSYGRWKEGEENPFIERLVEAANSIDHANVFYPSKLSKEDMERWLDGDKSLQPDCASICVSDLTSEQFMRYMKRHMFKGEE